MLGETHVAPTAAEGQSEWWLSAEAQLHSSWPSVAPIGTDLLVSIGRKWGKQQERHTWTILFGCPGWRSRIGVGWLYLQPGHPDTIHSGSLEPTMSRCNDHPPNEVAKDVPTEFQHAPLRATRATRRVGWSFFRP